MMHSLYENVSAPMSSSMKSTCISPFLFPPTWRVPSCVISYFFAVRHSNRQYFLVLREHYVCYQRNTIFSGTQRCHGRADPRQTQLSARQCSSSCSYLANLSRGCLWSSSQLFCSTHVGAPGSIFSIIPVSQLRSLGHFLLHILRLTGYCWY